MPPVIVSDDDGIQVNSFSATGWTPDTSAVLTGNLMIVAIEEYPGGAGGITPPSGWTLMHNVDYIGSAPCSLFYKVALADAPTEAFTYASASQTACVFALVTGDFDAGTPITDAQYTTDGTLANIAYVTNDLMLAITFVASVSALSDVSAEPSGFTHVRKERSSPTQFAIGWCIDVDKIEASGSGDTNGLSYSYSGFGAGDVFTATILIAFSAGAVPVNVTPPVVTGTPAVGSTLTTTDGTWTDSPSGFSYDWQRSVNGTTGWASVGPDQATFDLVVGDDGYFYRCVVTATNGSGDSDPEPSNAVGPVTAYPTVTKFSLIG